MIRNLGFNGLLVEQRDPEQLATAIIKILSRKDYGQQLGENGRCFAKKFGWEKTLREYAELYDQVNRNARGEKPLW
jgi:glycosyltransferase involved in cell wall biosynthesis